VPSCIEEILDNEEVSIKFMKIIGANRFMWPDQDDFATLKYNTILCVMEEFQALVTYTGRGAIFHFSAKEFTKVLNIFIETTV
jgi:hypothetical protein